MGVVVVIETLQDQFVHLLQRWDLLVASLVDVGFGVHEVPEDEAAQVLFATLKPEVQYVQTTPREASCRFCQDLGSGLSYETKTTIRTKNEGQPVTADET